MSPNKTCKSGVFDGIFKRGARGLHSRANHHGGEESKLQSELECPQLIRDPIFKIENELGENEMAAVSAELDFSESQCCERPDRNEGNLHLVDLPSDAIVTVLSYLIPREAASNVSLACKVLR